MVNLTSLFQSLPQLGSNLISNIYEQYSSWVAKTDIPAFHAEGTTLVFREGRILLNKQDVEELVDQPRSHADMSFWLGLSDTLKSYRSWYFKQVRKQKKIDDITEDEIANLDENTKAFERIVHGLFGKIYRKLKRRYDETTDGLSFYLDEDGCLTINGMKVEAFIEMASRYPTDKARTFLKGLRNRLSVILSNRNGNPNYDKIREASTSIFAEIDRLLGYGHSRPLLLPAAQS